MNQITRLRQRLKNVGKNVIEYKMTIAEARELISEIDNLEKELVNKNVPTVEETTQKIPRHIDGGTF